MNTLVLIEQFLAKIVEDPRISPVHISLYMTLVSLGGKRGEHPLCVFSHQVMPFCKISGTATYHKTIRELHSYGYITYKPSFNHFRGSLIYLVFDPPSGPLRTRTMRFS